MAPPIHSGQLEALHLQQQQQQQQQQDGAYSSALLDSSPSSVPAGASKAPPLHRNNACLACRRKKRKCDAVKPICGPCRSSARLYQEAPSCEWASSRTTSSSGNIASTSMNVGSSLGNSSGSNAGVLPPSALVAAAGAGVKFEPTSPGGSTSLLHGPTTTSKTTHNANLASSSTSSSITVPHSAADANYNLGLELGQNSALASEWRKATSGQLKRSRDYTLEEREYSSGNGNNEAGAGTSSTEDGVILDELRARIADLESQLHAARLQSQSPAATVANAASTSVSANASPAIGKPVPGSSTALRLQAPPAGHAHLLPTPPSSTGPLSGLPQSPHSSGNTNTARSSPHAPVGHAQSSAAMNNMSAPVPMPLQGNTYQLDQLQSQQQQPQPQQQHQMPYTPNEPGQTFSTQYSMVWNPTPPNRSPAGHGTNVLWTQWPADLPHLEVVKALAGTALAMIADTLVLLPADAVFRSLALPPTDPRFPSIALLHALCALGATQCPIPQSARGYWEDGSPNPSTYHFKRSKRALQTFDPAQILDDTRASILLTVYSFAAEQFIDVWQLVGIACRSLASAGLNHVQNNSAIPSSTMGIAPGHFLRKPTFLPAAQDDYDVFYRTTTLWQAFACDVWMGACSGWAMALELTDISTLLPVWPSDATPLDIVLNQPAIDPHSPLFFVTHLDSPMLSLHLSIKAMVLLRRVVDFLQRSTAPEAVITSDAKKQIRSSTAFVEITDAIFDFQHKLPDKAKYPIQTLSTGRLDTQLINAHVVPCTALLLLFEPFIYDSDADEGFSSVCMTAANRILQISHSAYAHSQDAICMSYTQINYSWMVCNRTLIRAMRFREDVGDTLAASNIRTNVEFLLARNSTLASRSPLVASCLGMIEGLIRDESPWHRK